MSFLGSDCMMPSRDLYTWNSKIRHKSTGGADPRRLKGMCEPLSYTKEYYN
jgi:hypothetical protein